MASNINTLAEEIIKVVSIDLNVDWSWYHEAIINLVKQHSFNVEIDVDTDILNAKKLPLHTVINWIENSIK